MSIELRIRETAQEKVRVTMTMRRRNKKGFTITAPDGTKKTLPTRAIALQFLLATVRCMPVQTYAMEPAK